MKAVKNIGGSIDVILGYYYFFPKYLGIQGGVWCQMKNKEQIYREIQQ